MFSFICRLSRFYRWKTFHLLLDDVRIKLECRAEVFSKKLFKSYKVHKLKSRRRVQQSVLCEEEDEKFIYGQRKVKLISNLTDFPPRFLLRNLNIFLAMIVSFSTIALLFLVSRFVSSSTIMNFCRPNRFRLLRECITQYFRRFLHSAERTFLVLTLETCFIYFASNSLFTSREVADKVILSLFYNPQQKCLKSLNS